MALEIIENGKNYKILTTNLQPVRCCCSEQVLTRQNKKGENMFSLLEFLFGNTEGGSLDSQTSSSHKIKSLEDQIEKLQNEGNSLKERVIDLENQNIGK